MCSAHIANFNFLWGSIRNYSLQSWMRFILLASTVLIPFFKSSAHIAGITGFAGLYLGMYEKYGSGEFKGMLLIIFLSTAIAWARIHLNRHTLKELLTGSILGFGTIYFLISK